MFNRDMLRPYRGKLVAVRLDSSLYNEPYIYAGRISSYDEEFINLNPGTKLPTAPDKADEVQSELFKMRHTSCGKSIDCLISRRAVIALRVVDDEEPNLKPAFLKQAWSEFKQAFQNLS